MTVFTAVEGQSIDLLPGPEVTKHFSYSTQVSMKFSLLIIVKMPTFVGILTLLRRKNSILGLPEPQNS